MPDHVSEIIRLLKKHYPDAKYYLNFSNPLELLVAAILSAQVRDETVNRTTDHLFKKYKTVKDYANADLKVLTNDIKSVTFASNKAKNVKETCRILVEKYNGKVPKTMDDLASLPGIGRKTANTILINAYGIVEGIPVDTWVIKLSQQFGWTKNKNPDKIEKDLMKIIPKENWHEITYLLKRYGKDKNRSPDLEKQLSKLLP